MALTRAIHSVYLVEADSGHPLLRLLDIAQLNAPRSVTAQASSQEDWQKEARKLALQGKQEQADAIERMILKTEPVPWPVLDEARLRETLAKVFRERAPGSKAKSQLYDYATCFDEPALARFLARDAGFGLAHAFPVHGTLFGRRPYQPYFARQFKDILKLCDKHGVEHRTPMNQTPLMAAAAAGNIPLAQALLERGADTTAIDHLGRNALHWAIASALHDDAYAKGPFSAIYQLVAPASIDLMAGERLVRIDARQSEYLMLQTMWVLFKWCFCSLDASVHGGFDAGMLFHAYDKMPAAVLAPERRKRAYISNVLARNEVDRDYAYNRHLFKRMATGLYQLNPALSLRRRRPDGSDEWVPVFSALKLPLIKELASPFYDLHIDELLALAGLAPAAEPIVPRTARR